MTIRPLSKPKGLLTDLLKPPNFDWNSLDKYKKFDS